MAFVGISKDWLRLCLRKLKLQEIFLALYRSGCSPEDLMCLDIKQNTEDLPGKIQELYGCIEGEVIDGVIDKSLHWLGDTSFSKSEHGYGLYITTDKKQYYIGGAWGTTDTDNPEEGRICSITLFELNGDERIELYRIWNTAGHLE